MAKGDHDNTQNSINTQKTAQGTEGNALQTQAANRYNNAYVQDQGLKSNITAGYENFLNPDYLNNLLGGFNSTLGGIGGVSGGIDESLIRNMGNDPYAVYKSFANGGGLSQDFQNQFASAMSNMDTANDSFKNFIATGGFSPGDIASMRQNAMDPVIGSFNAGLRNLDRNKIVTGSGGGNYNAAVAALGRDQGQALGKTTTGIESNLAQMVQQGKQFGTTGLAATSAAEAQAKTAVANLDAQLRLSGAAGMTDIEKSRLTAELTNAQINEQASAANAQIGLSKAGLQLQAAGIPMEALKGMTTLYGTAPGDTSDAQRLELQQEQINNNSQLGLINSQIAGSYIPSDFQQGLGNVSGVIGLGGQIAATLSGLPKLGTGGNNVNQLQQSGSFDENGNFITDSQGGPAVNSPSLYSTGANNTVGRGIRLSTNIYSGNR